MDILNTIHNYEKPKGTPKERVPNPTF